MNLLTREEYAALEHMIGMTLEVYQDNLDFYEEQKNRGFSVVEGTIEKYQDRIRQTIRLRAKLRALEP